MTDLRLCTGGACLAALSIIGPAVAQDASRAFAEGDYTEAAQLWHDKVDGGSAQAALRLGYLYDLGLGVPADPAKAFRYYIRAAEAGLAEAAFNVGVMFDSGTGRPRDVAAAALWYARAAARDHVRAQYNLGVLYADGNGVPQNSDLARYWLDRVSVALPAAGERLASLPPADRGWSAPVPVAAMRVDRSGGVVAEFVWTAPAGPADSRFEVQLVSLDAAGRPAGPMTMTMTQASALAVPIDDPERQHLWRVVRTDRDNQRYAAARWQGLERDVSAETVVGGQVRLGFDAADMRARNFAETLSGALAQAGIVVETSPVADGPERSMVLFFFAEDRPHARELAAFLPGLGATNFRQTRDIDASPGEIVVQLAFDSGSAAETNIEGANGR